MFPSDLDNAYAYEVERRKDEMRNAAKSRMERDFNKKRKPVALPVAILSILILLLSVLLAF
jgi:hypothetical protein